MVIGGVGSGELDLVGIVLRLVILLRLLLISGQDAVVLDLLDGAAVDVVS